MIETSQRPFWRRAWTIGGLCIAVLAIAWAFSRVEYHALMAVLRTANVAALIMVPLAIAGEQVIRAWKWRQLLFPLRPIGTGRLFGAIMAGYFVNFLVPLGISPVIRSWLVARLESLKTSAVLATTAIDRLIDGVIFAGFVALALAVTVFPDPAGDIRIALTIGGIGSAVLFSLILLGFARYKRRAPSASGSIFRLVGRLPARWAHRGQALALSFADGIVWPNEPWRAAAILMASIAVKLVAITHFLWAGLAFGVSLQPADYVFLMVFVGFLIILSRLARIPGGFFVGAIFALDLMGVPKEQALAMVLTIQFLNLLTIASAGAVALWRSGLSLDALRHMKESADGDG